MQFLHLADLHLGKTVHGVSMLENGDQGAWVDRFLALTDEVRPDAVVVAGDVYDRGAPAAEAVELLSRFLTELARRGVRVMLTAGNHDSGRRLSFAGELLSASGVHIAGTLAPGGALERVTLQDEYGPVTFWLMPYVFPAAVSRALGEEMRDYDAAVRRLLKAQDVDFTQRNVLVAHQNVTAGGAEAPRGGSETMVGGVGQVDYTAFEGFDYVALGHIHAGYSVGRESVRYAGSPLCYHFEETRQRAKGPVLVTLGPKGAAPGIETRSIEPLHPMREIKGAYAQLRDAELAADRRGEYLRVVLTDQRVTGQTAGFFRELYAGRGSVLMEIASEYRPFGVSDGAPGSGAVREKPVEELFTEFYAERTGGQTPSGAELALLERAGELTRHAPAGSRPTPREIAELLAFALEQEGEA